MAESLKCANCLEMYTEPKILECLHSFCLKCLQKLSHRSNNSSKCVTIICPVCQSKTLIDDLSQLTDNIFLENISMLKRTTSSDETRKCCLCSLKDKTSTVKPSYMCLSCGDWLCPLCARTHNMTRLTHDHRVVPLEDLYAGKHNNTIRMKQHIFCKEHNSEILRFFCKTCSILVCLDCLPLKHKAHDYQQPSNIIQELKTTHQSEIQAYSTSTNLLIKERDAYKSKLDQLEDFEEELAEKIRNARDNATSVVNEAASKAEADATKAMMKPRSLLRSKQNEIDKHIAARKAVESFCKALLDEGSEKEVLYLHNMIEKGIRGSTQVTSHCKVEMPDIRLESKDVPRDLIVVKGLLDPLDMTLAQCALPDEHQDDGQMVDSQISLNADGSKQDLVQNEILIETMSHEVIYLDTTEIDEHYTDVAWIDDNSFVLADNRNQSIIICNLEGEREWTREIQNVKYVAVVNRVLACGCMNKVQLQTYSPSNKNIYFSSEVGHLPVAKAVNNQEVITTNSNGSELRIYNEDGHRIGKIPLSQIVDIDRLTRLPNKQFFFSNHSKSVIGHIQEDGKVVYVHLRNEMNCGYDFKEPRGICSDEYENIFVADSSRNAVVQLSSEGNFVGVLDITIPNPQGVSIDQDDRLLVTGDCGKVWMIQL